MAAKTNNNGKQIKKEAEKIIIELWKELSIAEPDDQNDDTKNSTVNDNIDELTRECDILDDENENVNGASFEEIDAENNILLAAIDTALESKRDSEHNDHQSPLQTSEPESMKITSNIDDFLSDVDVEYL